MKCPNCLDVGYHMCGNFKLVCAMCAGYGGAALAPRVAMEDCDHLDTLVWTVVDPHGDAGAGMLARHLCTRCYAVMYTLNGGPWQSWRMPKP